MKTAGFGEAPGKVILLGEHTVVYGEPAIAAALDRRLRVETTRDPGFAVIDPRFRAALAVAAARFDLDPVGIGVRVDSEIPPGAGFGSSAALAVALVRALADLTDTPLSPVELGAAAGEVEDVFHGTASGVDVAAVASGGVVWFERGLPAAIPLAVAPLELVVADSGERRRTDGPVGRLRTRVARDASLYDALFRQAGEITRQGGEALAQGDDERLGRIFDAAHGILNALGVSTPTLERMIHLARGAGALGAKLTGAGGGGAMIALAPGRSEEVAAALGGEGFAAFVATLCASPLSSRVVDLRDDQISARPEPVVLRPALDERGHGSPSSCFDPSTSSGLSTSAFSPSSGGSTAGVNSIREGEGREKNEENDDVAARAVRV